MLKSFSHIGLHVLKTAVEAGTFSAAAQLLNISQPAVSAHIHRIEQELAVQIFERPYGRRLKLTESGRLVYTYAVEILAKTEELHKATSDLTCGERGQVKLAFSLGKFIIPSMVAAFRKEHPGINFVLWTGNSARVQNLVLNGEVDFGITLNTYNPLIEFKPFYREPMIMICAPDHPLAAKKVVNKQDLDKFGLISGLDGSDFNRFLYNSFTALGIYNLNIIAQVEEAYLVLKLVEEGGGVSLMLQSAAQQALERGYIVELSLDHKLNFPTMEVYQLFRRGAHLSATVNLFIKYLYSEIPKRFPFITLVNA